MVAVPILVRTADLQVTNLLVQPAQPAAGSSVTITWSDTNTGAGTALPPSGFWYDTVAVTDHTTHAPIASGQVLYDVTANGAIGSGQAVARTFTFTLPQGSQGVGTYDVIVTVDAQGNVSETNQAGTGESNNTTSTTFTSVPPSMPDLQIANLQL